MQADAYKDVNAFWLGEIGPSGWYAGGEDLDDRIRRRFSPLWRSAMAGALDRWMLRPQSALAFLVLLDQFPRNMFRGEAKAFASDRKALAAAKQATTLGFDLKVGEPERQFFYLPLMHSESATDQDRCVRLILTRMPETGAEQLRHACAHRDVIRKFGRFPYRNEALGRASTVPEQSYLQAGGYAA